MSQGGRAFWLWLSLVTSCWASEAPQVLEVLTRSGLDNVQIRLDEQDRQWLRQHPVLRMGISGRDYPPFEITRNQHELEGLTADYADLLAQLLGLRVEVRRFANRDAVMAALKRGDLDVLGTSNSFEIADPAIVLSRPYAEDQPMLVTRLEESMPMDLSGKRVAMVEDTCSWRRCRRSTLKRACNFTPRQWMHWEPWRSVRMMFIWAISSVPVT